jgi:hypothetical protein
MDNIRAFVGHSFSEDDANLISVFLRYFVQLSNLYPSFTWEHAEAAEPKMLAEKVMSLIFNKNVFIGICTKRELAIDSSALSPLLARAGHAERRPESTGGTLAGSRLHS